MENNKMIFETPEQVKEYFIALIKSGKKVKDDDIIEELRVVDIGNLPPLEALNYLYVLQNKVKNRW